MEITSNDMKRVRSFALAKCRRRNDYSDLDDFTGAGLLGLAEAGKRYEPQEDVGFWGYARYRVRGRIHDYSRRLHKQRHWAPAKDKDQPADHYLPSMGCLVHVPESMRRSMESCLTVRESSSLLTQLLGELEPTERFFLVCCDVEGVSVAEAARCKGMDRHQGRTVLRRSHRKMRKRLEELGYGLEDFS